MEIQRNIPLLEEILGEYRPIIGKVYDGYKNHVYRMIHFCLALGAREEDLDKLAIAGAFHDLGLFTENTVDYLPPSIELARDYLRKSGREAWTTEVELMIDMHHKLTAYKDPDYPLVEIFRRGDLVDFSLGLVKKGVPAQVVRDVRAAFPNAGFHTYLLRIGTIWSFKHPLNPAPIYKW